MDRKSLPLSRVYGLLEPGPVVLLTTADARKGPNVMTMSWHMMVDFDPPLIACVLGGGDYSYRLLRKSKECVINIPTSRLAKKVVGCGNVSGAEVDKFKKFGLTPVAASLVSAPLIDECYACIECRVVDESMTGRYGIFILEGVKAWVDKAVKDPRTLHHRGRGAFMVAGKTIKLPSKMK